MTVRDYLYLSWLSYLNLPELYRSLLERGGSVPVAAFADSVLRMDAAGVLKCVELNDAARDAAGYMKDSDCIITDYINRNAGDGFAAYVIKCGDETVVAMRGSESRGECVPSTVDWVDNFCEPFAGPAQIGAIEELLSSLPAGPVTFTGHSKGGHNALLALAASDGEEKRAVAFNGQGFSAEALTPAMEERLMKYGVNYVVAADVIGAVLKHPERRMYVKQAPGTQAHMPEAYTFTDSGAPVRDMRAPRSLAAEAVTRLADGALGGWLRSGLSGLCRAVMGRHAGVYK